MEGLRNTIEKKPTKGQELIGIHANAIRERNITNTHEINKRMDALCMDETIAKKALGDDVYQEMKSQLGTNKKFLDTQNKKEIGELPEFKIFLEAYSKEETAKEQIKITNQTTGNIEEVFGTIPEPEDIKKAKEQETIFNSVRANINSSIKKGGWFFESIRKSTITAQQANQIYDFIFEYIESPSNKKKHKENETSNDFYKRTEIDYRGDDENKKMFNKELEKRITKLKEKIKKWEEKEKTNIAKRINKKSNEVTVRDYVQEAYSLFVKDIYNNTAIQERFYLPEDKKDIEEIQKYFKAHLKETIPSPDKENLIKDYSIPLHTIERAGKKIKMNPNDYLEIERRKMEYKKRFTSGDWNPREYLFDRLTEYVGKDILEYKIHEIIKKNPQYRGTKVAIEKTDVLDDTSAGADYIATYTIPGKQKQRIAAIDLFISEKDGGSYDEEKEDKRAQKKESAKTEKIPYSTYINLFADKQECTYTMEPLKRYVEQLHPTLIYTIMAQLFKDKKTNITTLLESFDSKGALYTKINDRKDKNKGITKNIETQLHQNVFIELEKIAA